MKHGLISLSLVAAGVVASAASYQKKLGPEWTEDKEAQSFAKMMQIKVVRYAGGNVQNYHLNLDHDKVRVADTDGNTATYVFLNEKFNLQLRKDAKGHPSSVTVRNGDWMYYDINCDGEWDARTIVRPDKVLRLIWLNDQWVRVKFISGNFGEGLSGEIDFTDMKTEYIWDGKVWTVKPPRR